jgi:hypothetical protein
MHYRQSNAAITGMRRVINMGLLHGDEPGRGEPSFVLGVDLLAFLDVILCAARFAASTTLAQAATAAASFLIMALLFAPNCSLHLLDGCASIL